MNTHIHDYTFRIIPKLAPSLRHILEKIAVLFIPLPLLMLFFGTLGIIEKESPEHLANIGSMGSSFFNSLELHTLIIAGAFGVTLIVWFITRKIWTQSDEDYLNDELEEENQEHQDLYFESDYTEQSQYSIDSEHSKPK